MPWVKRATLAVAGDTTTAALVDTPTITRTKTALDGRYVRGSQLTTEVSRQLAADPTVTAAVATAATAAAKEAVTDTNVAFAQFDTVDDGVIVMAFRDPVLNNLVTANVEELV